MKLKFAWFRFLFLASVGLCFSLVSNNRHPALAQTKAKSATKATAPSKTTTSTKTGSASKGAKASAPKNISASTSDAALSVTEKQILDEINSARANPAAYVTALEAFRKNFRGKEIHFPDGFVLLTNEGVEAVDDAIKFLRTVKPLAPLEIRKGMSDAAKLHAVDLVSTGRSGHRGSDGSTPDARINRYGKWNESVGENIVYDHRDARTDVILMIIDDGTANRGHRRNLFKSDFRVIGISKDRRPKSSEIVVITFAGGFVGK